MGHTNLKCFGTETVGMLYSMDFLQNHVREEVRGIFPRSKTGQSLMNVGKGVIVLRSLLSSGIICAFSKTMCRMSAILKPPSGHSDATF